MAQIKNIKKPGDLIRGAKVGVAGLDKDGNVVGVPGITLPTPAAADVGKVLTAGSTGPVWTPIAGVTPLYYHPVAIYGKPDTAFTGFSMSIVIISTKSTPFIGWTDLLTWARSTNVDYLCPVSGSVYWGGKRTIVAWIDVKTNNVLIRGHYVDDTDTVFLRAVDIADTDGDAYLSVSDTGFNRII